ncbi:MAG: lamin tail domain-containing protein [Candidatus Sumerlaeaceae bacterium]|nr:lamin tail domain-containing protein [Candidatus Sumerlaeaceae bacterium]
MRLGHRARGSTFILVLALLSILVFLVAVLSYTTRLEGITSRNYAQVVQARTAAATGLPLALSLTAAATSVTTPMQPWRVAPLLTSLHETADRPGGPSLLAQANALPSGRALTDFLKHSKPDDPQSTMGLHNAQAVVAIADLSGRVNLNTIRSEDALARFLVAAFSESGSVPMDAQTAKRRARAVMAWRGNLDETTTAALAGDPRTTAPENFRRLGSVYDLMAASTQPASDLFTGAELAVLAAHTTVFSQAPEVYTRPDGTSMPRVPLAGLTARRAWRALSQAFPKHDPRLLMQFAANVADFSDTDDVPTIVTDPQHPQPWNAILGVEQTPLITEVYPDATPGLEGDDSGQFVEIHNPWAKPMVLRQWRLLVGATTGAGGVTINAVIPPNGFLILTDNYDNPSEQAPSGTGSFLSVFGARKDDNLRQLVESRSLSLPDENSFVALVDGEGHLIDIFSYTSAAGADSRQSYQRDDPRVRAFGVAEASPFSNGPTTVYKGSGEALAVMRLAWEKGNRPLASAVDLFRVSSAYAGLRGSGQRVLFAPRGWQMPEYKAADDANPSNLDARLLDIFTTVAPAEQLADAATTQTGESATTGPLVAAAPEGGTNDDEEPTQTLLYSYGKLNVNTCVKAALASLTGGKDTPEAAPPAVMERIEAHRRNRLARGETPFLTPSEFVLMLVPTLKTESDAETIAALLEQVTVGSTSFEVLSENLANPSALRAAPGAVPGAKSRMAWIVALDRQPFSLIGYSVEP